MNILLYILAVLIIANVIQDERKSRLIKKLEKKVEKYESERIWKSTTPIYKITKKMLGKKD